MSLLRGLAERALGTARAVHPQRGVPMRGRDHAESAGAAPASEADDSMASTAFAEPARALPSQPAATSTAHEANMAEDTNAPLVSQAVMPAIEAKARPSAGAAARLAHPVDAAPSPSPRRTAMQDAAPPQPETPMPDPAPLLARGTPPPREASVPARPRDARTPLRERQAAHAARAAAAASPTEVHVSIGRVELTALAPAPARRAERPRDAVGARDLNDYLRAPRGAS
jgi:hypothetical protein